MKREFLQNFKVGDQPLSKEIIDEIMAENGRDIEAAKTPYADYESVKEQLRVAKEGLKAFEGVDVKDLTEKIAKLQGDLSKKESEYTAKLAEMEFSGALKDAITSAKGRNVKAISALLDVDTLKGSKNQGKDILDALAALKKESPYLFEEEGTPPPFASGTGRANTGNPSKPESLLSALEERYQKG